MYLCPLGNDLGVDMLVVGGLCHGPRDMLSVCWAVQLKGLISGHVGGGRLKTVQNAFPWDTEQAS